MPKTPTFGDLLRKAAPGETADLNIESEPGAAFRAFFDGWVALGGYVRGKPRRSVRLIKIWLGKKHEVRSIETKLAGKTPMKRGDIVNLFWLFLTRWRYDDDRQEDLSLDYVDLDHLAETLTTEIYVSNVNGRRTGLLLPRRGSASADPDVTAAETLSIAQSDDPTYTTLLAGTFDSGDKIVELYRNTDALITVSRQRTFIGTDPGETMVGFHALMDQLRSIDEAEENKDEGVRRSRTLIWIVDVGRREGDSRSQSALHNLDFLALQFRSLLMTDDHRRQKRITWFLKRAVVLVGTLRSSEIDAIYRMMDVKSEPPTRRDKDWVTADRLFFEGLPDEWLNLVSRYETAVIKQRTITVHRDLSEKKTGRPSERDWKDLQFLFHMPYKSPNGELVARCAELSYPGIRWSDGLRMAHETALYRLGWQMKPTLPFSPREGLTLLKEHRFAVLTAREFCHLTDQIAFEEFE